MKNNQMNIIIMILFCITSLCWADDIVETQVGPVKFADTLMTESQFTSSFGQGYVQINKIGNKVLSKKHFYYSADEKVWIEIHLSHVLDKNLERDIEAILVTKKRLCDEKFKPEKPFGLMVTGKGIKIGDPIEKVIKTYGKPTVSINVGQDKSFSALVDELQLHDGQLLRYHSSKPSDLLFTEFYFKNGRLHSLLISASE